MSDIEVKLIVGLEIHVQLNTNTKLFCGCGLEFGAEPNSRVCPVCLGMPGVLPVMNEKAVEYSILAGLALNCRISEFTKWDRKSYYYPDLPKNFQTSQYDLPLCCEGFIEIPVENGELKRVRIIRAHLEEDAGKSIHSQGNYSQVDLNRTGTPLLEIVTEPDMNSSGEVKSLAVELQRIVRYLGVSQADMQKGHMRFEPNINLVITKDGKEYKTPIVEVKNLNSFRAIERSIDYERERQLDDFLETHVTIETGSKTTRGWDDGKQMTVMQREKELAHDYRYFPEPDLLPVEVDEKRLNSIKERMCELPLEKQMRFVSDYNLSDYDANVLTQDRSTAEYFDHVVKAGGEPKRICNILTQVGLKAAHEAGCSIDELGVEAESIAKLAEMIEAGAINSSAGDQIFLKMIETKKAPEELAEELGLIQRSDAGELGAIVDEVLKANAQAVEDVRSDSKKAKKARGFLLGQVMQKTKGQANPKVVSEILNKKL